MVKEIVRDPVFLAIPSAPAGRDDIPCARDLLDTLVAHSEGCVGMAANMIGVSKRIIAFLDGEIYTAMLNPEIVSCSGPYETEEGCLSLTGTRRTRRYKKIKVKFQDPELKPRYKTYTDYTAEIIQHELDHCAGILI